MRLKICGDGTWPTAKTNTQHVLPMCRNKIDHVFGIIYDDIVWRKLAHLTLNTRPSPSFLYLQLFHCRIHQKALKLIITRLYARGVTYNRYGTYEWTSNGLFSSQTTSNTYICQLYLLSQIFTTWKCSLSGS